MEKKIDIYYDGDCGVCRRIKDRILGTPQSGTFVFHDIRKGDLPSAVSMEAAIATVHATDDGKLYTGGDVVLRVLHRFPGWRPIAIVLSYAPLRWLVHLAYLVLAYNRWFFKHFI